jgi:CHAT domain-containing protein/tetratricopeptide (TPR) repeat protein
MGRGGPGVPAVIRWGYALIARSGVSRMWTLLFMLAVLGGTTGRAAAEQADLGTIERKFQDAFAAGDYALAYSQAQRLEAAARRLGPQNANYANGLLALGKVALVQGRYPEAEKNFSGALPIVEKLYGATHARFADTLNNLAVVYAAEGRFGEAGDLYQRALSIEEKLSPANPLAVATTLDNFGQSYNEQGRYAEAEGLIKRALDIRQQALEPTHPDLATSLHDLAHTYELMGRFADAAPLADRALAIREKVAQADHSLPLADSLVLEANLARQLGRNEDAVPLYQRALAIRTNVLGGDNVNVVAILNNLGSTYWNLGHYADAEPLYRRTLVVQENALGKDHPLVAVSLNNLGTTYLKMERFQEAQPILERALAIREKALGPDHPDVAVSLNNLAVDYRNLGRSDDAVPLLQRALAITEKAKGPNHPAVAANLGALANTYMSMGRFTEAEPLYLRAFALREKLFGATHPDVATSLNNLARVNLATRHTPEALDYSRRAVRLVVDRLKADAGNSLGPDIASLRGIFGLNLSILERAASEHVISGDGAGEGFEVAQWANQSAAANALAQLGTRFAVGDDELAKLVRTHQDTLGEKQTLEKELLAEIAKPSDQRDLAREQEARRALDDLQVKLEQFDARVAKDFPSFAELVDPKPLAPADVQQQLGTRDALVLYDVSEVGSFVWAMTRDRLAWVELKASAADLTQRVEKLRGAMQLDKVTNDSQLFDVKAAYALYTLVLGPVEDVVADKPNLLVVPSGALTSLPFHVLITQPPSAIKDAADYRAPAWLVRRQAVTVFPSVASVKLLRGGVIRTRATQSYFGVGDPIFERNGQGTARNRAAPKRAVTGFAYGNFFRGSRADIDQLRKALTPLPDTAEELRTVAHELHAPESQIRLQKEATEALVKTAPLQNYRILHFATHALVGDESARFNERAEPALALTLPDVPSDLDDGLLTSSEVAQLKLNADWVILSACNTAAGERPGAEALSGLARAFFYAGARSLLVSHWPVQTNAATRLVTSTIAMLAQDPTLDRAEALRRSMVALMDDTADASNAYPGRWAPFVIVGSPMTGRD